MSQETELETSVLPISAEPPTAPRVLWLGDHHRREFRSAWRFLQQHTRLSSATLQQATERGHAQQSPDLVVVAQAFPSQISHEEIAALRRHDPLVPLLALLGSWCEGETRSGTAWPGVPRLYWHQFEQRMRGELERFRAGRPWHWSEPVTASEEERFLDANDEALPRGAGLVVVDSPYFDSSQFLAEACRRQGYQPVEMSHATTVRLRGVRAAIWDSGPFDGQIDRLKSLAMAVRPAPVVALLSFPRIDQAEAALSAGATAVLSKPLRLSELFRLLSCLPQI